MTVKRIVLGLCFLMFASVCWGQYSTTVTQGATNITANLPTTNAWKLLPGSGICQDNSLTIGEDASLFCIGRSDHYIYKFAQTYWIRQDAMGTNTVNLSAGTADNIWGLISNSYCTSAGLGYGVYKWSGTAWTQPSQYACLVQFKAIGSWLVLGINGTGDTWLTTNGGVTYTQISGHSFGPNLSYVSAASATSMCGIGQIHIGKGWGNGVYTSSGGTFTQLAAQPSNQPNGCVMTHNALIAWNATWIAVYDLTAQTWTNVSGLVTISGATGFSLGTILALDSGGHPYHLNAIAPYTSARLSGSFTGCPSDTQPCPPSGVTHEKRVRVQYPHGLYGQLGDYSGAPTDPTAVSSLDFTAGCDLLFGNPSNPECHPNVTGAVICSVVGSSIYGPSPFAPCSIPPGASATWKKTNTTIHVYFNANVFSGYCPGSEWCYLWNGIHSWDHQTILNLTYQNMGLVNPCGGSPCNPIYPYIFVNTWMLTTSASVMGEDSIGQYATIYISSNLLGNGFGSVLEITGSHEEGHNQGLGDCDPGNPVWGCTAAITNTVMWHELDASQPHFPTPCDILNANFYEALR